MSSEKKKMNSSLTLNSADIYSKYLYVILVQINEKFLKWEGRIWNTIYLLVYVDGSSIMQLSVKL